MIPRFLNVGCSLSQGSCSLNDPSKAKQNETQKQMGKKKHSPGFRGAETTEPLVQPT